MQRIAARHIAGNVGEEPSQGRGDSGQWAALQYIYVVAVCATLDRRDERRPEHGAEIDVVRRAVASRRSALTLQLSVQYHPLHYSVLPPLRFGTYYAVERQGNRVAVLTCT